MTNKDMKRCSASLVIREIQIKFTIRDNFKPNRMAVINKTEGKFGEDVEKLGPSYIALGTASMENNFLVP